MTQIQPITEPDTRRRVQRKVSLALAALLACEAGARIVLPNVNGPLLEEYLRRGASGPLMHLYNFLAGGALGRGAILALGIVPYLSARIYLRLARVAFPRVAAMWAHDAGRARLKRWTRWLTGGFAVVQSLGFSLFLQNLPGVVANPGVGFIAQTMVVLTGGALFTMWIAERLAGDRGEELPLMSRPDPIGDDRATMRFGGAS
jgi:preprotein translocase subunit SecY